MAVGVNEQHLVPLLRDFDKTIYIDYLAKTNKIISVCLGKPSFPHIDVIQSPDLRGNIAFRKPFDFPIFVMLSHPICKFRSQRNYPIRENCFIANLGIVPLFFSSLNVMSVLKLWGERANSFFNPTNSPLMDASVVCWELPVASRPAEYSSMNFIIQNSSDPEPVERTLTEILEKYFKLSYWAFPKLGFFPSTHFLHGSAYIDMQVNVWKSLYVVKEMGVTDQILLENKTIDGIWLKLLGLMYDNGSFFFNTFSALIDIDMSKEILLRENLESSFINGIVTKIKQKNGESTLMTIVAEYGESYFDILTALIGMVVDLKYSLSDSVTDIGTLEDLKRSVESLFFELGRYLSVTRTLSEAISNTFELALNYMFPIILIDDQKVMFVHPIIWGFLKRWKLIMTDKEEQNKVLINLLRLLSLSDKLQFITVLIDESADYFSKFGINKSQIVRSIFQLAKEIRLCKTMKRIFESNNDLSTRL